MKKNSHKTLNQFSGQSKLDVADSSSVEVFFFRRIFLFLLAIASALMFTNCAEEMEPKEKEKPKKMEPKEKEKPKKTKLEHVATISSLNSPTGVAVADGKLYVADSSNDRIQVYNNLSKTPPDYDTTIGTGSAKTDNTGFNEPISVAVAGGKLYVADASNDRIQVYNNLSGTPTYERTIGTTGSAKTNNTGFNNPTGVAVANDKLYVVDNLNYRVQIYNNLSGVPTYERTIGTGSQVLQDQHTGFNRPTGVAVADGKLYVADQFNHRVEIYINLSGTPTHERTIGTGQNESNNTGFFNLWGVAVANGKLYVADTGNHRVQIYNNLSGVPTHERTIGTGSRVMSGNTGFDSPYGVAVAGDKLYVVDTINDRIQIYEWKE